MGDREDALDNSHAIKDVKATSTRKTIKMALTMKTIGCYGAPALLETVMIVNRDG